MQHAFWTTIVSVYGANANFVDKLISINDMAVYIILACCMSYLAVFARCACPDQGINLLEEPKPLC